MTFENRHIYTTKKISSEGKKFRAAQLHTLCHTCGKNMKILVYIHILFYYMMKYSFLPLCVYRSKYTCFFTCSPENDYTTVVWLIDKGPNRNKVYKYTPLAFTNKDREAEKDKVWDALIHSKKISSYFTSFFRSHKHKKLNEIPTM